MNAALQQILYFVFVPIWVAGFFILSGLQRAKQRAYRRRLPPVDGIRILDDHSAWVNPFGKVYRALDRVTWDS